MKALIDRDIFEKGLNRYFARFPYQLWIVSMILTAIYKFGKAIFAGSAAGDTLLPAVLSSSFYHGTLIAFGLFYLTKILSLRAAKNSWGLENVPDEGYFLPCVMGANIPNSKMGNLEIRSGEFFFQPDRQYKDVYDFKVPMDAELSISVESVEPIGKRMLTSLILGAKQILVIQDKASGKKYTFIVPETEMVAEELKKKLS